MALLCCRNRPTTTASLLNVFVEPYTTSRTGAGLWPASFRCFSVQPPLAYPRKTQKHVKDANMMRGMSAIKGKGLHPKMKLSVKPEDVPMPIASDKRSKIEIDENHGLWGFFNKEKELLSLPDELGNHGRAWSVQELRRKSWNDLHCLWWLCLKERNRLATEKAERNRLKAGYGDYESDERDKTIRKTMRAIKHTLTERWYVWEDARKLAQDDQEIMLSEYGKGPIYKPTVDQYDSEVEFEEDLVDETSLETMRKEGSPLIMESDQTVEDKQDEIRAQKHAMVGKSTASSKPSEAVLDVPMMGNKSQSLERSS